MLFCVAVGVMKNKDSFFSEIWRNKMGLWRGCTTSQVARSTATAPAEDKECYTQGDKIKIKDFIREKIKK